MQGVQPGRKACENHGKYIFMSTFQFNAVLVDFAGAPLILGTPTNGGVTVTLTDTNGPGGAADFFIDGDEQHLSFTFGGVTYDATGLPLALTGTSKLADSSGTLQSGNFFLVDDDALADALRPLMPAGSELAGLIPVFIPDDQNATFTVGADGELQDIDWPAAPFVCFGENVRILTDDGDIRCRDLNVGDLVFTQDGRLRPIRWIGRRRLTQWDFVQNPKLRPVRITAGALGQGLPVRDMLVSRQHRMLVSSVIAERVTEQRDVLIPAIRLTELPGIEIATDAREITYTHLLFDQHEVVFAEGAPSENLLLGAEALKAISLDAREETLALFPFVADPGFSQATAQVIPDARFQKMIIQRHMKNNKPLLSDYSQKAA